MKKVLLCFLMLILCMFLAGCEKKCDEDYTKENDKCVKYVLHEEALLSELVCNTDDGWNLKDGECVKGEMPPIGDGCEEGTTDRIGEDGFCHYYMDAAIKYSCNGDFVLKDNACYEVIEAQ